MTDSYIEYNEGRATSFVGADATNYFRANTLRLGIKFYGETGMKLTRHIGIKDMLAMAKEYTGKDYKGKKDCSRAVDDLTVWIEAMRTALPAVQRK